MTILDEAVRYCRSYRPNWVPPSWITNDGKRVILHSSGMSVDASIDPYVIVDFGSPQTVAEFFSALDEARIAYYQNLWTPEGNSEMLRLRRELKK